VPVKAFKNILMPRLSMRLSPDSTFVRLPQ
jgi:hypothetical protein